MKKIGFIGLGVMGFPMAANLAKVADLVVFDIDASKMSQLRARSVIRATDIGEVGRTCDLIFLSLPSTTAVLTVVVGKGSLAETMKSGSILVDSSTTETARAADIAVRLKEKGIHFLDAPVSGGERAAVDGTLSFMVGGDRAVFESCDQYFRAMGTSVVWVGDSPAGQIAKCVNQMIVGATFAAIAEAFALGVKAGLDPKVLYEAIKGGWAGSKVLDVAAKDMFSREFRPGGSVNIHWKDLGYALSLAQDQNVPTPLTALTHEIFKAARAAGVGKESQPAVVKLWERLLRLEVE